MGEDSGHPTDSTPIQIIDQPSSSSQPKKDKSSKKAQRQEAEVPQHEAEHEESVPKPFNDLQPSGKGMSSEEIAALEERIQRVESSKDQKSLGVSEDASKQGRSIVDIDADVEVTLVYETQVRHNDDLIFDTGVLDDVEMPVEAKVDGKMKQKTKKRRKSKRNTIGSKKMMLGRKRAGKEQQKESLKKQKVEEEKESEEVEEDDEVELKKLLVIKKDEDIAIDVIPLATKLPVIIDYKLHKEGMMLQGIDREDLEALWRIVKAKYGDTRPEDEFERVLYGDLRVMFEPDIKSDVWRMLQGYRVTTWKLIDSSGVHFGRLLGIKDFWILDVTTAPVLVEELKEKFINEAEVLAVVEEEGDTWMTPIYNYLTEETLPVEKEKARHACRKKICGSKGHTDRILLANNACGCKKINKGMSRLPGSPPCAKKPATKIDSHHVPVANLQIRNRHSRTLPERTWKSQIPNSGNGLLYEMNRSKACHNNNSKDWIEELPHVLWAHRTMIKSSNGDTSFSLTYGMEAVIPTEIGMPTIRTAEVDMVHNDEALEINLDLLEERREQAAIREAKSKAKMEKYYNSKVRNTSFKPGDLVYRSNEASHAKESGKLSPKWEGPYEVTKALGNGAYKIRDSNGKLLPRTWNVHNLKKYYVHEM
ncbi:reverse transcriptase domain-containing protein [Tanacetum coccineum]